MEKNKSCVRVKDQVLQVDSTQSVQKTTVDPLSLTGC